MPPFNTATLEDAVIYMPEQPAPPISFAAEELQRYLQRMTGLRLGISRAIALRGSHTLVLATESPAQQPASRPAAGARERRVDGLDNFTIGVDTANITLTANSPRTVLSAVYALLAQLGCQWSLDSAGERVPRLATSVLELDPGDHAPHFTVRGYCSDIMTWHYTQPEYLQAHLEEDRPFIDGMAKTGANAFFYIRHPFDTQLTIPELLPDFERRGIDLEYGGHVMPLLLPREEYRRHPEYFPQAPDGRRTDHGNLCTSSVGALATASANAVRYVREHPEMCVLHIWGADLWRGGWCHCAACRRVSVQDQSLRVCNAVARALADAGVARPVCYLAYHDTIEPAVTVRPEDNVTMEFAPRERCYRHAINDPECATNRRYATALERYLEWFRGRGRLFEYYGDAILFAGCAVPLSQVVAADLAYYQRLGIQEITMLQFGAFSRWAYRSNFAAFAAGTGTLPQQALAAHGAAGSSQAGDAQALYGELETIMAGVVTYGDIRRPPRSAAAAAGVLARIEAALPRLEAVSRKLETFAYPTLCADAALVRYTRAVLDGVRLELQQTLAGEVPNAQPRYADAIELLDRVDARLKGVWGRVDLPIVHGFYNLAPEAG